MYVSYICIPLCMHIAHTDSDSCDDSCQIECSDCTCSETDNTAAIIGGVVAIVLILSITTALTVIVIVLFRSRRGDNSTRSKGYEQ